MVSDSMSKDWGNYPTSITTNIHELRIITKLFNYFLVNCDYDFQLSDKYLTIAESELREDERRREQALVQFREWISKHSLIRKCSKDPVYLLRFLRTKKFSVPLACEMLEQYLMTLQLYPSWFKNLDVTDPTLSYLVDAGYLVPLRDRDEQGRKVCLIRPKCLDPDKCTATDIFRLCCLYFSCLLDEEENQIAGYVFIFDMTDATMKIISLMSISELRNWINCFIKAFPIRMRQVHLLNVPPFARTLAEFGISVMSDKLKKRVNFISTSEDLENHVNPKILPKEYGGHVPIAQMIQESKENLMRKRQKILSYSDQHIVINRKEDSTDSSMDVGSFRKLNFD